MKANLELSIERTMSDPVFEVALAEDPLEAGGVDEAVGLDDAADVGLAVLALDLALEELEHAAFVPSPLGYLELPERND